MAVELLSWFEIPVADMDRARRFYEQVLERTLVDLDVGGENYPCIPNRIGDGFSGALVAYDFLEPGRNGTLAYLDAGADLDGLLDRVRTAGGNLVRDRAEIAPGFGYFALFEDSEGNLLGATSS